MSCSPGETVIGLARKRASLYPEIRASESPPCSVSSSRVRELVTVTGMDGPRGVI